MSRPYGSVNKIKRDAQSKADELGIDTFEVLLLFAAERWEELGYPSRDYMKTNKDGSISTEFYITPEARLQAAKEATSYLLPKRKSVEFNINELPDEAFDKEAERRLHLKILKGELKADDVG